MGGGQSKKTQQIPINHLQTKIQLLIKQIEELKNEVNQAKQLAKQLKDPMVYRTTKEKLENMFINQIKEVKFDSYIKRQKQNEIHVSFIGRTSVGKTSLINSLFGKELKVGLGKTTTIVHLAHQKNNLFIWDAPGLDEDWDFYDQTAIRLFHDLNKIYVFYDSQISDVKSMLKLLLEVNKNVYLVRTKCDNWKDTMQRSIQDEKKRDYEDACKINPIYAQNIQVFVTSDKGGFDNQELKKHIQA